MIWHCHVTSFVFHFSATGFSLLAIWYMIIIFFESRIHILVFLIIFESVFALASRPVDMLYCQTQRSNSVWNKLSSEFRTWLDKYNDLESAARTLVKVFISFRSWFKRRTACTASDRPVMWTFITWSLKAPRTITFGESQLQTPQSWQTWNRWWGGMSQLLVLVQKKKFHENWFL